MAGKSYCKGGADHLGPKGGAMERGSAVKRIEPSSGGKAPASGASGVQNVTGAAKSGDKSSGPRGY